MTKLIIFIAIILQISCGEAHHTNKKPQYDPSVHKLGSEQDWQEVKASVLFSPIMDEKDMFKLPQDRRDALRVKNTLLKLHSWFQEGVGYREVHGYDYDYIELTKIPEPVLKEVITRMEAVNTGFGVLDQRFWKNMSKFQKQGFRFALITNSPIPIAGFYSFSNKLVAFDLFSNSGTIEHEMQHHLDYQKLEDYSWFKRSLGKKCRQQLSNFLGEVSATTEQMPVWKEVILNKKLVDESIESYQMNGGKMVADNLIYALQANLEYPTERGNAFLANNSCRRGVKKIVEQIRELTSRQVDQVIGYDDVLNFSMKFRVKGGEALLKAEELCIDNNGVSTSECAAPLNELKMIKEQAKEMQKQLADRVEQAWQQRLEEIPKILSQLKGDKFEEACSMVLGFKNLAHCSSEEKGE